MSEPLNSGGAEKCFLIHSEKLRSYGVCNLCPLSASSINSAIFFSALLAPVLIENAQDELKMFFYGRHFSVFTGCQMGTSRSRIMEWFGLGLLRIT